MRKFYSNDTSRLSQLMYQFDLHFIRISFNLTKLQLDAWEVFVNYKSNQKGNQLGCS